MREIHRGWPGAARGDRTRHRPAQLPFRPFRIPRVQSPHPPRLGPVQCHSRHQGRRQRSGINSLTRLLSRSRPVRHRQHAQDSIFHSMHDAPRSRSLDNGHPTRHDPSLRSLNGGRPSRSSTRSPLPRYRPGTPKHTRNWCVAVSQPSAVQTPLASGVGELMRHIALRGGGAVDSKTWMMHSSAPCELRPRGQEVEMSGVRRARTRPCLAMSGASKCKGHTGRRGSHSLSSVRATRRDANPPLPGLPRCPSLLPSLNAIPGTQLRVVVGYIGGPLRSQSTLCDTHCCMLHTLRTDVGAQGGTRNADPLTTSSL